MDRRKTKRPTGRRAQERQTGKRSPAPPSKGQRSRPEDKVAKLESRVSWSRSRPVVERAEPAEPVERVPAIPSRPAGAAVPVAVDTAPDKRPRRPGFPIVGIGASAGGLEALEQFLGNVPADSGMAFIVVQHLDPSDKGMLASLLQRTAKMPVAQAKDGQVVEPNRVYLIPPNKDISLLHGALHVLPQSAPHGLNLPIDFFFRSLAEDLQEDSIGVILSGMGSDGTLGLRAIKEKAGVTFVQSIGSAKFDGMPRSAMDANLADVVAPADEIPAKILAYQKHEPHLSGADFAMGDKSVGAIEKVFILLRSHTGSDFSLYKKSTLLRRIERRMGLHQIDSLIHYVRFLRENPREIDMLFRELLIGVTNFFRDPSAWDALKTEVLPGLLSARPAGSIVRAWVPGCSTGEEAYSLAMVFKEAMEPFKGAKNIGLQIFATDLDRDAIEKARLGFYPDNIVADVTPERLRRFFMQEERGYRVSKEIRETVVFAPQNVISDPPFTKLDILSCRNLLIYLSSELQKKLIPLFHYSLSPAGVLFLGSAETVGSFSSLFFNVDAKSRIYRRLEQPMESVQVEFPTPAFSSGAGSAGGHDPSGSAAKPSAANLQSLADRVLVQRFSPVAVLCNERGDVLYISGRAGKYLEPAVGKANLNVFAMARDGLRFELSRGFNAALRQERLITLSHLKVGSNGGTQSVECRIQKLNEPEELRGTVILVFTDLPAEPSPGAPPRRPGHTGSERGRSAELEEELARVREEVQTTREEMQTSQEELKSTNEELQSTNEELQSTNEELTTSKEEMQSLNEELQTVNHELQAKVDELSRSNNDMKNLLNSTDIATLFLDGDLNVRRFTTPTARIIKLIPSDVGRPVTDIASEIEYPDLADDARDVLRTLVFKEKQAAARDGRWFAVRIMPYRTLENVIDGVVITFTDISANRTLENTLRVQADQLRQMTESLPNLVGSWRPDGACDYLSRQWIDYTGIAEAEQLGYGWLEQIHAADRERFREDWRAAMKAKSGFDAEVRIRSAAGTYRWFKSRAVPIRGAADGVGIVKWYGTCTDIDDLKRAEESLRQSVLRLTAVLESINEGFFALDGDLAVTFVNRAAQQMLGQGVPLVGKPLIDAVPALREVEGKLRDVLQAQAPLFFDAQLESLPRDGGYRVRAYPQSQPRGLSIFFERKDKDNVSDGEPRSES